ncbi:hypothetical protein [Streptomyces hygroscopicus]|uniref:hypothetical protein n=1 Tax=Streptomyces hygroscopicus TaxID=1912 RepID=UPI000A9F06FD|nr:hypothetical protein [Streptomyces hygroscopicus]
MNDNAGVPAVEPVQDELVDEVIERLMDPADAAATLTESLPWVEPIRAVCAVAMR